MSPPLQLCYTHLMQTDMGQDTQDRIAKSCAIILHAQFNADPGQTPTVHLPCTRAEFIEGLLPGYHKAHGLTLSKQTTRRHSFWPRIQMTRERYA